MINYRYLLFTLSLITSPLVTASIVEDKSEISQLMLGWGEFRDQGRWEELANTFHPDGVIAVTWYSGSFSGFVKASKEMAKGKVKSKHLIGGSVINVNGNKAISLTSATIMGRVDVGPFLIDLTSYARFYDKLEKRNNEWKIISRETIYEKDRIDSVEPSFLFWINSLFTDYEVYPEAYRYLGYGLEQNGFKLIENIIMDKTPESKELYKDGNIWLMKSE